MTNPSAIQKVLMSSMSRHITMARTELAQGRHDPTVMDKLSVINTALQLVRQFECNILTESEDID